MKVSVILAHPDPGSLNRAIADASAAALRRLGHEVRFHDLCAEGFDPLLPAGEIPKDGEVGGDVRRHCGELKEAGGIVVVHPNWWGQPPAILKGWIDRVIRPGVAYEFLEGDSGEGVPRGLLTGMKAVVFNTANTPDAREREVFGDPLERIWRDCVFGLCGVTDFTRRTFSVVVTSTDDERREWLREVGETMERIFPAPGSERRK